MKKLLYILLLISCFASAQEECGINVKTQTWAINCSVYPKLKELTGINMFINYEVNDGNWSQYDVIYVLGVGLATSANVSLIAPATFHITNHNSSTFTAYQGYTGNASTMYLDLGFNTHTQATNFTQNSSSSGVYARTTNLSTNIEMSNYDGSTLGNKFILNCSACGGGLLTSFCETSNTTTNSTSNKGAGFFSAWRNNSTTQNLYWNGASFLSGSSTSTSPPNVNMWALVQNFNGTGSNYSNDQLALVELGGGSQDEQKKNNAIGILKFMFSW